MKKLFAALGLIGLLILPACAGPALSPTSPSVPSVPTQTLPPTAESAEPTASTISTPHPTATPVPPSPTPDPPRTNTPDLSAFGEGWATFSYKLQPGDDLGKIAAQYGVTYDQIRAANGFDGGETRYPGQVILVPQKIQRASPPLKLLPDSELVYGPGTIGFDTLASIARYKRGYLYNYSETVNGESVSGAALVQRAAESYSLNPRLLIALVEYQSGWLTQAGPAETIYPFGRAEGGTEGLYRQLQWTANALNRGFYGWRDGSLSLLILGDGRRVGLSDGLNAGTTSLQYFFSLTTTADEWEAAVSMDGFIATYTDLFGDPFTNAVEPLVSPALTQPELSLPWQGGETWFYSGGPHPSFGPGSSWGAVDFLPPGRESRCEAPGNWVTAVAPGVVARSGDGQLLLDLDQDGFEQTGWVILYLHVAEEGRPEAGAYLNRGDHVGHPSCEGGFAKDAHIHLARKHNGVWLAVDGIAPFVLGDYTVTSSGQEYNGALVSSGDSKAACACRESSNAVTK